MSAVHHQRARVAALSRSRTADDPEFIAARQALAAAKLHQHIDQALAGEPPLTDDQRTTLAAALAPSGGDAA